MSTLPGYRRTAEGVDPPYGEGAYTSTHKRAPRRAPIRIAHTLSEITGPRLGAELLSDGDGRVGGALLLVGTTRLLRWFLRFARIRRIDVTSNQSAQDLCGLPA